MPVLRSRLVHVTELTSTERGILVRLNMGSYGNMRQVFQECLYDQDGWVVIHYSRSTGAIDGWALIFDDFYYGCETVYVYVSPTNRRRGIGTQIMRHVRTRSPEPIVVPWDERSVDFFSNHANVLLYDKSNRFNRRLLRKGKQVDSVTCKLRSQK